MKSKSICVYCGSRVGDNPIYAESTRELAKTLVKNNLNLVYGGGRVGLMGTIADEVMRLGGKVYGVIPENLFQLELGHESITQLNVVKNMSERKAMMMKLSDGFIALPGGIGTLEELFEGLSWWRLKIHKKPVGILNVNGYYDGLIDFLREIRRCGFITKEDEELLIVEKKSENLMKRILSFI